MNAADLITRLKAGERSNELDIAIEIALFVPDQQHRSVRPNSAGTKVIYTRRDGKEETFWAHDWSMKPDFAIDELRAAT